MKTEMKRRGARRKMGLSGKECNLLMGYELDREMIQSQQGCGRLDSSQKTSWKRDPETGDWDCAGKDTEVVAHPGEDSPLILPSLMA